MSLIDRKLGRDLWAIKGRVVSLACIIASGVGILFAIQLALQNILATQENFLRAKNFADLEVNLLPEDTHNLPRLDGIEGVARVASRLMLPGRITLPSKDTLSGLVLFQDSATPAVNGIELLQGRAFRPGANEVVVDVALADYHRYRVGDRIAVQVGKAAYDYLVVGIARSPEFLVTTTNPDYVIAEPGSLGVIWADARLLHAALGFSMVNSLLFRFEEGADGRATVERVMARLARLSVEKVTPRAESYSFKQVRMELNAFGVYSPAIIVTLCTLSLAMGIITFRRFMVEKEREFGVLSALGYARSRMLGSLLRMGLLVGLAGGLLGLALGWGVGWAFPEVYASAMHLPFVVHRFDPLLAWLALAVGLLAGCAGMLLAALPTLRLNPRRLLQPLTPGGVGGTAALGAFGVMVRYSLRSLLRERVLTGCAVLAMGGAIGVAIAYGLAMTSTFGTVERSFRQERWSHAVDFQYPVYQDETDNLLQGLDVGAREPYYRSAADIRHGDRHAIGILVGLQLPGSLRQVAPAQGRALRGEREAVLSADLARELGVALGGAIELAKGGQRRRLVVVGLTNDIYLRTINVALPVAQELAQAEGKLTGLYLRTVDAAASALAANTVDVARVTDKVALVEHFRTEMADKMGVVYITIVFSVGVSILFVTTLVYLGIAEKRGEYAILRSLGFSVARLRASILTGVGLQIALSLLVSVPIALVLVRVLNERMGRAWFAVDIHMRAADFLWPMLASLAVAPIVGLFGARAVLHLNIPQFIRGRAI